MTLTSKLLSQVRRTNESLAKVGGHMVAQGRQTAQLVGKGGSMASGLRAAAAFPVKELGIMCARAGAAGAVVDAATGGYNAIKAMRQGKIDGQQAAIHTVAEAGCGFVTSTAGTAGTLAAYMATGAMGPLAIAAGMGASVGSRHLYRAVVGETLPRSKDES